MGDIIIIGDEGKVSIDKCKGTNLMLDIGNGKSFFFSYYSLIHSLKIN